MNPIKTLFVHKEILLSLTAKNLKSRFVGSALGFLWAFINPLLLALIVSYVFTNIFKTNTKNFYLFIISGMLPWTFLAASLQDAVASIPANAALLKQFALPREFIPLASVLTNFVFFLLGLFVVMPFFVAANDKILALLPLLAAALLCQLLFTGGLSLIFSAVYVSFRDVSQILNTVLMLWLWLTPVFFSIDMISPDNRIIFELNPMTPFINLYRNALLGIDGGKNLVPAVALALVSMGVGYAVFYKQKNDFLKRI